MLILQNGILIDSAKNKPKKQDLWIDNGKIIKPESKIPDNAQVMDVNNCWITPGLIDSHCNLCDPGYTSKESIESGSKAAVSGGFTTVFATPNTKPVADCITILEYIKGKANQNPRIDVLPLACATKGMKGKEIVEMESLYKSGAVAFYDTEFLSDLKLFKIALQYAASIGSTIVSNPQNKELSSDGVMHQGEYSVKLGLFGIPEEAETTTIASQIEVLRTVPKANLHFSAISCARSVDLIRKAKEEGLNVTVAVAAQQLIFSDEDIDNYNTQFKVTPPLRSKKDKDALISGIFDGTIDVISSHHSPQNYADKSLLFEHAPFGVTSLETSLASLLSNLVKNDVEKMQAIITCFTDNINKSFQIESNKNIANITTKLEIGERADVIIIDPQMEWTYSQDNSYSQSSNNPYLNQKLKGRAIHTIKNGELVWSLNDNK